MCGSTTAAYAPTPTTNAAPAKSAEYQYAIKDTNPWSPTRAWVHQYEEGFGFVWGNSMDGAQLFQTATEAEAAITGRNEANTPKSSFIVVPVKLTTTTKMTAVPVTVWEDRPQTTTTRELA